MLHAIIYSFIVLSTAGFRLRNCYDHVKRYARNHRLWCIWVEVQLDSPVCVSVNC